MLRQRAIFYLSLQNYNGMPTQKWREENQDKFRQYRRDWYERNKARAKASVARRTRELIEYIERRKAEIGCNICGESHPGCLDFHHREPADKEVDVSRIAHDHGWSIERIEAEITKCDVLCANCHRKLHWSERRQLRYK